MRRRSGGGMGEGVKVDGMSSDRGHAAGSIHVKCQVHVLWVDGVLSISLGYGGLSVFS